MMSEAVSAILLVLLTRKSERIINIRFARLPYTVDLVIFGCLNFREFLILGLFTKFRIIEFSFFFSNVIIIIIFAKFLNS